MIHLDMIDHNVVDLLRVTNDTPDTVHQFAFELRLDRIHQGDFVINDEIRIVGAATVG